MTLLANVLLVLGCLPMLLLTFAAQRSGPEGPVGAHMITDGWLARCGTIALASASRFFWKAAASSGV